MPCWLPAEGTHPDTRRRDKGQSWESIEENLVCDLVTFMKQLGLS
jgi:hypothetical protein